MNITPIRRPTLAPLIWLPAGLPCVYRHWRRRDHLSGAPRTSFTDGEDVTGSRRGGTSNGDLGLRVRLAWLKSP
jgi:hypothetical protein